MVALVIGGLCWHTASCSIVLRGLVLMGWLGFGKGSKERIVPMGYRCQRTLVKYVHRFRSEPALPSTDYVFLTFTTGHFSRRLTHGIL